MKYYAVVDGEKILPLGEQKCFDDADDCAPISTTWIHTEESLAKLLASAQEALKAEPVKVNSVKEKLVCSMIDRRIGLIRDAGDEEAWMADVMNFGWVGYDKHSDQELLDDAEVLKIADVPSLEDLGKEDSDESET